MLQTIAGWTEQRLTRFIQNVVRSTPSQLPRALTLERLTTTKKLVVQDEMELSPQAIEYLKDKLGLP